MNELIILTTGAAGAPLTYYVGNGLKQGRVRASALLSLLVGVFFHLFPTVLNEYLTQYIPLVFIGSSFIGMVSAKLNVSYFMLCLAGLLFGFLFMNNGDFFDGFGGELGALAFISLLVTICIRTLLSETRTRNKRKNG